MKTLELLLASAFACLLVLSSVAAAAPTVSVTGTLSPDLETNPSMDLVITVTGISDKNTPLGEKEESLAHRLEVRVLNSSGTHDIATSAETTDTNNNNHFYWVRASGTATPNAAGNDSNEITFTLTVLERSTDAEQTLEKKKETVDGDIGIKVEVYYYTYNKDGEYHADSPKPSAAKGFIKQINAIPDARPEEFSPSGTHEKILIKWSNDDKINFTDDEQRAPGGVLAMVFKTTGNPGDTINLDSAAKVATLTKEPATQGACTFIRDANEGTDCIVCDDANTYLDLELLKAIPGAEKSKMLGNTGAGTISDIDEDDGNVYTIALQYKFGNQRTECYNVAAENNLTLTELLLDKKGEPEDIRCFIATAAYGSAFDEHIIIFRWFRGQILLSTDAGKYLVEKYYKLSPPLANYIANHEFAKTMTKAALFPVGVGLNILKAVIENLALFLVLLSLGIVGTSAYRMKLSRIKG